MTGQTEPYRLRTLRLTRLELWADPMNGRQKGLFQAELRRRRRDFGSYKASIF